MTSCRPAGQPRLLPQVAEASGVAVGRALWTHNDSSKPILFRLEAGGQTRAVSVTGSDVRDWEDLAIARCPAGECLYIADIGDNRRTRDHITIYRVPEPAAGASTTSGLEVFHARYPDRPHDAEALVVTQAGAMLVITKEVPPRVYRFPTAPQAGAIATLELVRPLNERIRVTGAAASGDGQWIALRSNGSLLLYRTADFLSGGDPIRINLTSLKEPQGEGVAFARAGELYLVSEAGDSGASGVLTRVNCTLPK